VAETAGRQPGGGKPPPGEPAAAAAQPLPYDRSAARRQGFARPVADGATLVARHTALYADWLASAPGDHYFIQLTARGASHTDDIERFLSRARQWLEPAQLRVYVAGTAEDGQIGVIYGDYPSRAAAWEATRAFPEEIRRMRPYPRPVSALQ
jgi:septal ring-binding cell division protein DamX